VATALRAAFDPVLPPGFGFAVVNDDGKVLLHSDRTRNLEENLVQECDGDARLRSAILRHRSIALDVPYYGRPYRLVVEPLAQMPWTLVVFRDRGRLADVTALIGLSWIVLFGGYFLVYLLALAGVGILRPGYRAVWLWPDPNRIADYHRASALLAVLGVGAFSAPSGVAASGMFRRSPACPSPRWPSCICCSAAPMPASATGASRWSRSSWQAH